MSMDKEKQRALEAAGFKVGTVEEFLGLSQNERDMVEFRVALSKAVRRRRKRQQLTQQDLAKKLKSSQSRVAKVEAGASDVSLDLLFRTLFEAGGNFKDVLAVVRTVLGAKKTRRATTKAKKGKICDRAEKESQ